ncbi:hypothetical protein ANTHELSMS3_04028 [Antarctobacter heliothermus]|uniref:Lipoprotein n=1 Tax=Antarctobacter heliothermus TaxID=74033 RepID=A0A222E8W7_9RHOB|nr:hypothetical protein [Antarctobacter heliothermus]ASP22637.1 hypothetical protein ANTHELSMS3_04028 [Antarctobacter heliothermus]
MQRHTTTRFHLALCLGAAVALSACGDNLGEQAAYGAGAGAVSAVALDVNVLTGAAVGVATNIAYCSTYPSRC